MYAAPRPFLPGRCSTFRWSSPAASLSARSPVPSGLLSSTTRMSAAGTAARTRPTMLSRLASSLYVGMMTATWPMGPRGLSLRTVDVTFPASGLRWPPVIGTCVTNDRNSALVPLKPHSALHGGEKARDALRTGWRPVKHQDPICCLLVTLGRPRPSRRVTAGRRARRRVPPVFGWEKLTADHCDVNRLDQERQARRRAGRGRRNGPVGPCPTAIRLSLP